jgi:flagellar hook-associated protein 2
VSTSSTTSSTTPSASTVNVPFTGISQYASDFQAILNKAAQVAQIPVTQLQTQDATVLSQETALSSLQTTVGNLATSVQNLGTLAANLAIGAISSNPAAVSVNATGATSAGSYTINSITSIAAASSETSLTGVADSSNTSLSPITLVVGGQSQTFQLATNDLNGLVSQINGLNAGVTASIVASGGSNKLSLTAASGPTTIQLYDGPNSSGTDLLTATGAGTETSTASFGDPGSTPVSSPSFTLQFGSGNPITFQLSGANDNLVGLSNAINASGAGVTSSILTTSNGNYLSIQANNTGANALALYAGTTATGPDLLTGTNQGSDAKFQLDGITVQQQGNVVNTVIPGVTFTLLAQSTAPVTLTLASDPSQLSSDLQDFVTQYNALATAVTAQTGPSGGPITGDTVIEQLQQTLQQIAGYTTSSGTIQSLSDLGVEFTGTNGQASFDSSTFNALSQTQISDALTFIGSTTSGLGGFSQQLTEFSDPIDGVIQSEVSGLQTTDQDLQNQISTLNTQIGNTTTALTAQLESADAQQAELQQQQTDLTASLEGLSLVLYGQNPTVA